MTTLKYPLGFAVTLNKRVTKTAGGKELIGGTPTKVLYLTDAASRMIPERTATVTDRRSELLVDRLLETGMADPVLGSLPASDLSTVTVIIPVFGRPQALARVLDSLGGRYKVIVVDDCSPEPEAIKAVGDSPNVQVVRLTANVGPAKARNVGLELASTPFIAFADSDVVIGDDTIGMLLKHFNDPQVALAGPRILGLDRGPGMNWIERYEEVRSSLDLGAHPAMVRPRSPVAWLPGAFMLARKEALGEGFTPESRVGEDVDLVWRLVEQGWRVRYEPEAQVWHEHRRTLGEWLGRKVFYGTSAHPLALRHGKAVAPAVFAPWSLAVVTATLAQRRWSAPVVGATTAYAALHISRRLRKSERPLLLGASLASRGVLAAQIQTMTLLVRHWWPLAAIAGLYSRRVRRAIVFACVVDAIWEYKRTRPRLDPFRFALARRMDDMAYGAGVWLGAIKGRSLKCLLPDVRRSLS